jgi:transposase-like protein
MIKQDRRKAIRTLFEEGKTKSELSRIFNIDPKTVRKILSFQTEEASPKPRSDKKEIDSDLLRKTYVRCDGYVQRVHEVLTEENGIEVAYSTLARMLQLSGISKKNNKRCHHVGDFPGAEMQHDTTLHRLKIGKQRVGVVCSGLYLRYCKMRYVKFYPFFNRFKMKCFFYEVLTYWGYAAKTCVIDNTNLAILHGTGKQALFNPEMIAFAKPYGFEWFAHAKGHANRKAGTERNFWTIETNFIPGRSFESMEDLNRQALEWACCRYARRPLSKSRLVPIVLFEEEKPALIRLPSYVEPPYQCHQRNIDPYGYIAFNANYYWVPGKSRGKVSVIEYSDLIKIYQDRQQLIEYRQPKWKVKNQKLKPPGVETNPYEPKNIKKPCQEEEKNFEKQERLVGSTSTLLSPNKAQLAESPNI